MLLAFWQMLFGTPAAVILTSTPAYTIAPVACTYMVTPDV
jgi:hypothetical protein